MDQRKRFGFAAEALARSFLEDKGYRFIEANFKAPFGEIDLIFLDGEQVVFVEVKARQDISLGDPEQAVNRRKLNKLMKLAEFYLQEHPEYVLGRIDVVGISYETIPPVIEHFENVTV